MRQRDAQRGGRHLGKAVVSFQAGGRKGIHRRDRAQPANRVRREEAELLDVFDFALTDTEKDEFGQDESQEGRISGYLRENRQRC